MTDSELLYFKPAAANEASDAEETGRQVVLNGEPVEVKRQRVTDPAAIALLEQMLEALVANGVFVFNQLTPSTEWTIEHPLAFNPSVVVVDSAHQFIEPGIIYSPGQVILTFTSATSGRADLS